MKTTIAAWWVLPVASLLIACGGPPPPRTPPLPSSPPLAQQEQEDEMKAPLDGMRCTPDLKIAAYRIAVGDSAAYDAFRVAMGMKDGPARDAQWRKAAALYKVA